MSVQVARSMDLFDDIRLLKCATAKRMDIARRILRIVAGLWSLSTLLLLGVSIARFVKLQSPTVLLTCVGIGLYFLVASLLLFNNLHVNRSEMAAIRAAAEYNDPRVVGALLDAFTANFDVDTYAVVVDALIRLLPRLSANDSFTQQQLDALYLLLDRSMGSLQTSKQPQLVLSVLAAIEIVGDSRAVPRLEAAMIEAKPINAPASVQAAIENCLLVLYRRQM